MPTQKWRFISTGVIQNCPEKSFFVLSPNIIEWFRGRHRRGGGGNFTSFLRFSRPFFVQRNEPFLPLKTCTPSFVPIFLGFSPMYLLPVIASQVGHHCLVVVCENFDYPKHLLRPFFASKLFLFLGGRLTVFLKVVENTL